LSRVRVEADHSQRRPRQRLRQSSVAGNLRRPLERITRDDGRTGARGDARAIADAGRALGAYDARSFAGDVDVPVAVVLTTKDRLVRPRKQRALAKATGAHVIELAGDHDVPWMQGPAFGAATREAVRSVVAARKPVRLVADG
jgi:hypothetical protein